MTNRSFISSKVNESLETNRSKVKFKLTPIKYIIPENQTSVMDLSVDKYFDSKANLLEDIDTP